VADPFSLSLFVRWLDLDFNQHMRNAAYLGASEDCRMHFLAAQGFGLDRLRERNIGPVVVEDRLTYKKELRLLEPFRVELALAGITSDARRMKVRNSFYRAADNAPVAQVESVVLWFDLATRKPTTPPDDLKAAWLSLTHTDDFSPLP
jgi:acyl-CoA thioester hydrolase